MLLYRNHLLEPKSAFLRRRNRIFFEEEVGIVLFNLNNVVSVEKEASLRTFEDFHHFFLKRLKLEFLSKIAQMLGLMISPVSVRIRKFLELRSNEQHR